MSSRSRRVTEPRTLFVVATPIGNLADITVRAAQVLREVDVVACEDTRHSGRLLKHLGASPRRLVVANEHTEAAAAADIVRELGGGASVALISDAGTPAISDPGQRIVAAVIDAGFEVSAVPGPSAGVAALVVSGLSTARWVMEGFLPRSGRARVEALAAIATDQRTTIVYESPKRLPATLDDLVSACGPDRQAAVVRELTKLHEEVTRGSLAELAERYSTAPRGEVVVVIGGAPSTEVDDDSVATALDERLAAGATVRDAVDAVVAQLGAPRNRVYELAIEIRDARGSGG